MNLKTSIIVAVVCIIAFLTIMYLFLNISINDEANTRLQTIDGMRSKVEGKLDNMNKILTSQSQVVKGEKDAFIEFQRLVSESKKGQSIGGIMTQINEKYPNFEIKGFDKLLENMEIQRDEFYTEQVQYNSHITEYNKFIVKKVNKFFLDKGHVKLEQFIVSSKSAKQSMISGEDELKEINF